MPSRHIDPIHIIREIYPNHSSSDILEFKFLLIVAEHFFQCDMMRLIRCFGSCIDQFKFTGDPHDMHTVETEHFFNLICELCPDLFYIFHVLKLEPLLAVMLGNCAKRNSRIGRNNCDITVFVGSETMSVQNDQFTIHAFKCPKPCVSFLKNFFRSDYGFVIAQSKGLER